MKLKQLECDYESGQLFRHMDGGYYKFEKSVLFADDSDELVIYEHLWPFEKSSWARRYSEFKDRFTKITQEDLDQAMQLDRKQTQDKIEATRTARRAAKNK